MQCEITSFKADSLMEHLKKHSEAKSNKSSLCDFASSQASNMRRHLMTHTGGKSNKCNQCGYQYSQARNLWEHLKIHHGEEQNNAISVNICTCIRADRLKTQHNGEKQTL